MSKNAFLDQFTKFAQGQCLDLLTQSVVASAATMDGQNVQAFVGEISAARRALEASFVAPGIEAIFRALTDVRRRPPEPRDAMHGGGQLEAFLPCVLDNDADSSRFFEVSQVFVQRRSQRL